MDKKDNPMSRLMELAAPYKGEYVLSVILAILGVAAGLLPFFAVSKIVILFYSRKQHYRFYRSQWRRQVYHYEADCGILGCNKRNCQVRRNRYSQNSVVTAYG